MKLKARSLHFELTRFQRVDETGHLFVEGYAFVNPDAGDGYVWERAAMEAATHDFMKWAAVREMHARSAVGTASGKVSVDGNPVPLGVTWDEKGAYVRALVVDPVAIEKVETGVYKGFSSGIKPVRMRGKSVQQCDWIEISLVDRPQDKDCHIERLDLIRSDDADQDEFEVEVRASFAEYMEVCSGSAMRSMALDWLWNALWDIQNSEADNKGELVRETCDQFRDFMVQVVEGGTLTLGDDERAATVSSLTDDEVLAIVKERGITSETPNLPIRENLEGTVRFERVESGGMPVDEVLSRLTSLHADLERAQASEKEAKARLEALERKAKPQAPVVRFPEALERTFAAAHQSGAKERNEIDAEIARIEEEAPKLSEKARNDAIVRLQVLKQQRAAL